MPTAEKKPRERILDAATESFQALGYAGTTTQTIATQAEVAEVTIFRHFGEKQKLFQAVVQRIGGGLNLDAVEAQLTGELEIDLRFMGRHMLDFLLAQQNAIRMLMFESIRFPEMRAALAKNPNQMLQMLNDYFQRRIEAGQLQGINPQVAAQSFMCMLFGYAMGMEPIGDLLPVNASREETLEGFVRIFLRGIRGAGQK